MKKTYIGFAGLSLLLLLGTQTVQAQQGFGTDKPNKSAAVDIQSSKRGLLIPRVNLKSTVDAETILSPAQSLMVYNQATTTVGTNDVTPGYYYWDGAKWARFAKQSDITAITLDGDVTGKTGDTKVVAIQGTSISNVAPTANQVLTLVNGVWTPTTITSSLISDAKGITGTGITVGGTDKGAGSVLKEVTLSITHGTANQVMVTNADGTGTTWVDQKDIVKANETVTTVVDGTNTTVSSSVNPAGSNTTEYKVNVSNEAIQGAQKLTTVSEGNGVKVTPVDMGNNTTDYNVAIDTDGGKAGDVLTVVDGGTSGDTKVEWKTPNYENIYTHDGTLTGNRTVDFGKNISLIFKRGNQSHGFTYDSDHTGLNMYGDKTSSIGLISNIKSSNGIESLLKLNHDNEWSHIYSSADKGFKLSTYYSKNISFETYATYDGDSSASVNFVIQGDGGVQVTNINEPEFAGKSTDKIVVADAEGVLKTVERTKIAPQFFYMPAVIFDTKAKGTGLVRDLYQEYVNQFTGGESGSYDIAHGAGGYTMPYTGGVVGSDGAPADIAVFDRGELHYYVTYYDTKVFKNLKIDKDGKLTYDIVGNATPASYMNIVFVIK